MFGGFQPQAFQPAFQQIEVTAGVTPAGGGGGKKHRRYYVEIDGERFFVRSAEEAAALLQQAARLAERAAEATAQAIVKARTPRIRRLGKVAPVEISARIKTDAPQSQALRDAQQAIQRIYDDAAKRAELQLLLERQAIEDDENDIEDLIAMGAL